MLFLFADHSLDTDKRELRRGSEPVAVEPQVFDLLVFLLQNRDRVVSKEDLIASVRAGRIVSDSTLTSRINAARRAIGDSGEDQNLIRTIARKGLRFVGEVRHRVLTAAASMAGQTEVAAAALQTLRQVQPNVSLAWIATQSSSSLIGNSGTLFGSVPARRFGLNDRDAVKAEMAKKMQ